MASFLKLLVIYYTLLYNNSNIWRIYIVPKFLFETARQNASRHFVGASLSVRCIRKLTFPPSLAARAAFYKEDFYEKVHEFGRGFCRYDFGSVMFCRLLKWR